MGCSPCDASRLRRDAGDLAGRAHPCADQPEQGACEHQRQHLLPGESGETELAAVERHQARHGCFERGEQRGEQAECKQAAEQPVEQTRVEEGAADERVRAADQFGDGDLGQ